MIQSKHLVCLEKNRDRESKPESFLILFLFLFLCVCVVCFFSKMKDFILEAHFQMPSSLNLTYPMTFQFPQSSKIANKKLISRENSYYIGRNWQLGNFAIINQSQDGVFPYLLKHQHIFSVCFFVCLFLQLYNMYLLLLVVNLLCVF